MEASNGFYLIDQLLQILPTSPFAQFIDDFSSLPWLGVLNWFVPVQQILTVMVAWLGAVSLFYLYSVIMRWVKLIGD